MMNANGARANAAQRIATSSGSLRRAHLCERGAGVSRGALKRAFFLVGTAMDRRDGGAPPAPSARPHLNLAESAHRPCHRLGQSARTEVARGGGALLSDFWETFLQSPK